MRTTASRHVRFLMLALAGLLTGGLAACGGSGDSAPSAGSAPPPPPLPPPPPPPPPPSGGLDARPVSSTCVAPARSVSAPAYAVEEAFPDLPSLAQPVALVQRPASAEWWYVLERAGRVVRFRNRSDAADIEVVVDLRDRVEAGPGEAGLLGIAFDPGFASNGEVYLSYTRDGSPLVSYLSRFASRDDGATLDPASESVLLTVEQDFGNHNGGQIAFGPDGHLYFGLGDGGSGGDPLGRAQDTTNLLGAMLRLDPGGGVPYGIPPDNPFAGNALCNPGGFGGADCPEIYAWGLRNPWRWSFDRATGDLWVGDVGQNDWEEIDLIERGGNYGWNVREGANCYPAGSTCDATGLVDPVAEYDHGLGRSVTGGYVYRGSALPSLVGRYVFGDFASGRIWALTEPGRELDELVDSSLGLAAFGEGRDGELYLVDLSGGRIMRLVETGTGIGDPVADRLSATGCVDPANATVVGEGLIPYGVNAPFHSDGATKRRWMAVPGGETVAVEADGDFAFPPGTVLVKEFRLGGERVETRLFMRHPDGQWAGYTYQWNTAGTDAERVRGGTTADVGGGRWRFPSQDECMECHTAAAGFSLGLGIAQQNGELTYPATGRTANQLTTLDAIGVFDAPLAGEPATLPAFVDPYGTAGSLEARARTWLDVNCSGCHRPGGPTPSGLDLRFETALRDTGACDVEPEQGTLGISGARLIAPGDPGRSVLVERMSRRDVHGMPPVGSLLPDAEGVTLVSDWIDSLGDCG